MDNENQNKKLNSVNGNVWWSRTSPQRPGDLYISGRHPSFEDEGLQEPSELIVAEHPDYFRMPNRPQELGALSGMVMRVTNRTVETCICEAKHQANFNYGKIGNTHLIIIECVTNGFMIGTYDPT